MAISSIYSDLDINMTKQTDGDVKKNTEFDAIKNSLTNIINTMKGSRVMLPEFSTNLYNLLFEPIDEETARLIGEEILQAVEFWDDRVEIVDAYIIPKTDENLYDCTLNVRIKTTNEIKALDFILK